MLVKPDPKLDADVLAEAGDGPVAVALSGGGDSMALLHLLWHWGGARVHAVSVDHGLRAESAGEAQVAGQACAEIGVPHEVLRWDHDGIDGNLQAAAREARYALIADWARARGIGAVFLGHTADDQAETFLMRLARGSGVDGLAAMDGVGHAHGLVWLRPMLHLRRAELRDYLRYLGASWVEDPSNKDRQFERVRVREALATLDDLGIDVPQIEKTTRRLKSAKQVLYTATKDLAELATETSRFGEMRVDHERLLAAQPAIRLRLLSEAVRYIAGSYYAPRAYMIEDVITTLGDGRFRDRTLHGCQLRRDTTHLMIRREGSACEEAVDFGAVWDGRWMVSGPKEPGLKVAALGEKGVKQRPEWRETGAAAEVLATTPAIYRGEALVAAPLLDPDCGWEATICLRNDFFTR